METYKNLGEVENPYLAAVPPSRQKRSGSTRSVNSRGMKIFVLKFYLGSRMSAVELKEAIN